MIFVGFYVFLISLTASALVPVEGIILGEAQEEYQSDPLKYIFRDTYDTSKKSENKKLKFYLSFYNDGLDLLNSCSYLEAPKYSVPWDEKQARRSMAATLQYIGLDTTIKAVGAYSHKLGLNDEDFLNLKKNLVKNYCSKNLTVFSLKTIEKSLDYYFKNPPTFLIPSISASPFATKKLINSSEKLSARSREFDFVLKSFRSFCSWGGEVDDYRLLTPYLRNNFIMAEVIKNMSGLKRVMNEKTLEVSSIKSDLTVQVACVDLICRKETSDLFNKKFPLTLGSTGLEQDLRKNYCHHFKFQDPPQKTIPNVKEWISRSEIEEPIFETSQFISLMTGIPDFFNGIDSYGEMITLLKSSIDQRWDDWALRALGQFSHDFMFEESMKIKMRPRGSDKVKNFELVFDLSSGEMDRIIKDNDKLSVTFEIELSKNYLRHLRTKWITLQNQADFEEQKKFKKQVSNYLGIILKEKEKLFSQKLWSEEFFNIVAEELISQSSLYEGDLFHSYQDEILKIPVKFSYGLFAIGFLKYRADVANGRVKFGP